MLCPPVRVRVGLHVPREGMGGVEMLVARVHRLEVSDALATQKGQRKNTRIDSQSDKSGAEIAQRRDEPHRVRERKHARSSTL